MSQKVRLLYEGVQYTVHVEKVLLTDEHIQLEGLDPSLYPSGIQNELRFHSKNLMTRITDDDPVSVVSVTPSDEPVPTPSPFHHDN